MKHTGQIFHQSDQPRTGDTGVTLLEYQQLTAIDGLHLRQFFPVGADCPPAVFFEIVRSHQIDDHVGVEPKKSFRRDDRIPHASNPARVPTAGQFDDCVEEVVGPRDVNVGQMAASKTGPIEHEQHPRSRKPLCLGANSLEPVLEPAGHPSAFRPSAATAADRPKRIDDPVDGLVADHQRFQFELIHRRHGFRLLFEHDDQVRFQRQDGFQIRVEISADAGFLLDIRRILAIPRHPYHSVPESQGVQCFGDAGGHRHDPPALPARRVLQAERFAELLIGQDAARKNRQDRHDERYSV